MTERLPSLLNIFLDPRISGFGGDRSAKYATNTALAGTIFGSAARPHLFADVSVDSEGEANIGKTSDGGMKSIGSSRSWAGAAAAAGQADNFL